MRRNTLVILLFCCFLLPRISQAQLELKKITDEHYPVIKNGDEDSNEVNRLNKLAMQMLSGSNYPKADSLAQNALQLADKLNYKTGQSRAYCNIGLANWSLGNYPVALNNCFTALKIDKEAGDKHAMSAMYGNIANIYRAQGNYPEALSNDLHSLEIDVEIGNTRDEATLYANIGIIYGEQANYPEALKNELQSLKMAQEHGDKQTMAAAYGNLGNIYFSQGNYPEALKKQLLGLKIVEEMGNKRYMSLVYSNIGNIYGEQKNYSEALKNMLQSLKISEGIGYKQGTGITYANIGQMFVEEKKYAEAKMYLDSALALSKKIGSKHLIRDTYYGWAVLDSSTGNYKAAYNDYKLYSAYVDSLKNEESERKMVSEQMNSEFEKKMALQKAEQEKKDIVQAAENKRKRIIDYGAIIILAITLIFSALYINVQKVKRKKEKALMESEKKRAEEELLNAKKALQQYTVSMIEKTELLEQFKTEVEKLKEQLDKTRIEQLEHLNKATILTEQDWDKFRNLFDQVHKGFFTRLKQKMPDLTYAEIRLICLTKLKLGTKHMAGILGVSSETIKKTRHRLRKKMGLEEEDSIDDITESI